MYIPKCGEIKLACVKCGSKIETLKDYEDHWANIGCWENGAVSLMFPDYKSQLEGCGYIIGICIECLRFAIADGHVHQFHDKYGDLVI